jgi:NAD(P)-dependent dehydrogenase (short-subunit alcohol dehydrogenase family)
MAVRGRGLVLHVTTDAAVTAYPGWGAYGVSKAALDHLARSFAVETDGVRFLGVDPGEMDTKMHADALPDADRSALGRPDEVADRIVALIERAEEIPSGSRLDLASLEVRS